MGPVEVVHQQHERGRTDPQPEARAVVPAFSGRCSTISFSVPSASSRSLPGRAHIEQLRARIAEEYEAFSKTVAEWSNLRDQWLEDTKRAMVERWEQSNLQSRLQELEYGLRLQYRRMRVLQAQLG